MINNQSENQFVAFSGTGTGGTSAPLTFTPASLTFANQIIGTSGATKIVTVKNTSAAAVTLSAFSGTGYFAATGGHVTPCSGGQSLAAGASCTVSVEFTPDVAAPGVINGSVTFTDNASVGTQVLDVKGTVVLPLSFTPASLTFPAQTVATASAPQTVTITNNLPSSTNITIVGSGDFTAAAGGTTPCTATLASLAKCTINVTFTPSAVGTRASAITVTDTGNPNVQTLSVTGTGQ